MTQYRVDGSNASSISMHLDAIKTVLDLTTARNRQFSDTIKRALFWQDLYSCLFVGTTRLLSHRDYEKFCHETISASAPGSLVPPGFEDLASDFPDEFIDVIRDLNSLCTLVDTRCVSELDTMEQHPIDNLQYCIESRLVDLLSESRTFNAEDLILQACIFACFLVTYKLSTGIWEGCFIPEYCATQVMVLLTKAEDDLRWEKEVFQKLSIWLSLVSGSLAQRSRIQSRAINLLQDGCRGHQNITLESWDSLVAVFREFIWSNYAMEQPAWRFWQKVHSPKQQVGQLQYDETILMHPAYT